MSLFCTSSLASFSYHGLLSCEEGAEWEASIVKPLHDADVSWWCRGVQTEVYNLIKDWSLDEHSYLRESVPKMGLQTPFREGTLQDVALKVRIVWHALPKQLLP